MTKSDLNLLERLESKIDTALNSKSKKMDATTINMIKLYIELKGGKVEEKSKNLVSIDEAVIRFLQENSDKSGTK